MKLHSNFKAKTLLLALPFLEACSPYVYEKEIKTFAEGVEITSQTMFELKKQRIGYLEAKRDEFLIKNSNSEKIDLETAGCDDLRKEYTNSITKNVPIDTMAYGKCYVTPQGLSTDPGLLNIFALSESLNEYASALTKITKAEDENDLKNAYLEFNNSTKAMLEALNNKLDEKGEKKYDAVAGLVWTTGSLILNQRRFDALKDGINEADPIVMKISALLEEGAFNLHEKNIRSEYEDMVNSANSIDSSGDYLNNWKQVDQKVTSYVNAIKNNPVNAFKPLQKAHASLKESINNPSNQKQLEAVFKNTKAFKDSADSVKEALK